MNNPTIAAALALTLTAACASEPKSKPRAPLPPPPAPATADRQREAPPAVHTLSEAVRTCLERNTEIELANARVGSAEANLRGARSALWPMVGAQLSVLWADAPSVYLFKTIDARSLAPNTDFNDPGSLENTEAALGASWNLWRGGRDELTIRSAELGVEASRRVETATRNALIGGVTTAWLQHLAARELVASDEARIRGIEQQIADARARLEAGAALQVDVLALEVRIAQARERRTSTELARELTLAALRELLALDGSTPIEPDSAPLPSHELPNSHETALETAHARRADLAAGRALLDAARARLRASERAYWPSLDLQARVWGDDDQFGVDFAQANSSIALSMSFDVVDGGARGAGIDGARAELIASEARLRASELAVAHDVDRAWLGLSEARARLEVAGAAEAAASEALELVSKQVASGAASVSRYLDAESDLAEARAHRVAAQIDVERSGYELLGAMGTLEDVTW